MISRLQAIATYFDNQSYIAETEVDKQYTTTAHKRILEVVLNLIDEYENTYNTNNTNK